MAEEVRYDSTRLKEAMTVALNHRVAPVRCKMRILGSTPSLQHCKRAHSKTGLELRIIQY